MAAALKMEHGVDPKELILSEVGDISGVELLYGQILVAPYIRPSKTASGIYLSDRTIDEDVFQGKAALVLKVGPRAFVDDGDVKFHGQKVDAGDWVIHRVSDGWDLSINKRRCRVLQDVHVKARIPSPDLVW